MHCETTILTKPCYHWPKSWSKYILGFPGGTMVKTPPTIQETQEMWVRYLGEKDPLEQGMATHSSILIWKITWTEEPGGLVHRVAKSRTWQSSHACIIEMLFHFQLRRLLLAELLQLQIEWYGFSFTFLNVYLFIWLHQVLVIICGVFNCVVLDLVPWPGMKPRPPALRVQKLPAGPPGRSHDMGFLFLSLHQRKRIPGLEGMVSKMSHSSRNSCKMLTVVFFDLFFTIGNNVNVCISLAPNLQSFLGGNFAVMVEGYIYPSIPGLNPLTWSGH